ncbi:MAG: hypothetical protein QOH71_3313 [Blastocatellia bacterium]|jgi:hypothetical protein|nr:hypothetical protein [Blastocatellia bacterium]
MGAELKDSAPFVFLRMERGHPVRQRAKAAQSADKNRFGNVVRATRSGGQDVRAPLTPLVLPSRICSYHHLPFTIVGYAFQA